MGEVATNHLLVVEEQTNFLQANIPLRFLKHLKILHEKIILNEESSNDSQYVLKIIESKYPQFHQYPSH